MSGQRAGGYSNESGAWRLYVDGPASGARNMAVDHALFESVQAGSRPVLRLYRWDPRCLSLGRNQPSFYDPIRIREAGATLVRRPTGGRAVLHDCELTYAIIAPVAVIGRPRTAFIRIHRVIARALLAHRVPVEISGGGRSARPDSAEPCFGMAAPGEIVADGQKLVGSAQRMERNTILQHGSILLDGDQSVLTDWIATSRGATDPGVQVAAQSSVSVRAVTGAIPDVQALCRSFVQAARETLGIEFEPGRLTSVETDRIGMLEHRYAGDEWTRRR